MNEVEKIYQAPEGTPKIVKSVAFKLELRETHPLLALLAEAELLVELTSCVTVLVSSAST